MSHDDRLERNDKSRNRAEHYGEEWSADELEFLMTEFAAAKGDRDQEELVAEILGRTIEGCRQRFYEVRSGKKPGTGSVKVTTSTTRTTRTTTVEYRGTFDDPDDQWWSPDYYTEGK